MVALVAGSTCGRGRVGQRQSLINRHPELQVAVEVQVVERVAGRETRRTVRSFRLAPGEEERLGCSADGRLTKEYAVLRAEYRVRLDAVVEEPPLRPRIRYPGRRH